MPRTRLWRIRFTISVMMTLIAGTAVLIFLLLPLVRLGKPPCLTPVRTARWLLTSPGKASCTNCHANPAVSAVAPGTVAIKAAAATCPLGQGGTVTNSCTDCHIRFRTTPLTH